jgi:hypothetical protein
MCAALIDRFRRKIRHFPIPAVVPIVLPRPESLLLDRRSAVLKFFPMLPMRKMAAIVQQHKRSPVFRLRRSLAGRPMPWMRHFVHA